MEPKIFIHLVTQMREAQKQYFRTRKSDHLQNAKDREHEVDAALRGYEKRDVSQGEIIF